MVGFGATGAAIHAKERLSGFYRHQLQLTTKLLLTVNLIIIGGVKKEIVVSLNYGWLLLIEIQIVGNDRHHLRVKMRGVEVIAATSTLEAKVILAIIIIFQITIFHHLRALYG